MEDKEIDALVEDLKFIKGAVRKHDRLLRELLLPKHFGPMSLYFGLSLTAILVIFHGMGANYGGYGGIPPIVRVLLWAFIAFVFVSGGIMKWMVLGSVFKRTEGGASIASVFRVLLSAGALHIYISILASSALGTAFLINRGLGAYCVPYLAVVYGIASNSIASNLVGGTFGFKEYLVIGYWLIFSGFVSLFFAEAYPFLVPAGTFGLCLVAFGVSGTISRRRDAGAHRGR